MRELLSAMCFHQRNIHPHKDEKPKAKRAQPLPVGDGVEISPLWSPSVLTGPGNLPKKPGTGSLF